MNTREIIPRVRPASVDDIIVYESDLGPWSTKSGGLMHVVLAFPKAILETMLYVDDDELKRAPKVELGLRAFHTRGVAEGTVGGKHFHRIKQEVISLSSGKAEFLMEDVYGGSRKIILDHRIRALLIPPFVMHTYTALEETELIGVSNTLYDHDDPETHDTYSQEVFDRLREHYSARL